MEAQRRGQNRSRLRFVGVAALALGVTAAGGLAANPTGRPTVPTARPEGSAARPEDSAARPSETAQLVDLWAPEPGWQLLRDHPVDPDVFVVGTLGQEYLDPEYLASLNPPQRRAVENRRSLSGRMPRLVLRCENRATALLVMRPLPTPTRPARRTTTSRSGRSSSSQTQWEEPGLLILAFGPKDYIEIDLARERYREDEPVYIPDPYATIGRLRRAEKLYYFHIERGRALGFSLSGAEWGTRPDAEFVLEGLDELLATRRDPCKWQAAYDDVEAPPR